VLGPITWRRYCGSGNLGGVHRKNIRDLAIDRFDWTFTNDLHGKGGGRSEALDIAGSNDE